MVIAESSMAPHVDVRWARSGAALAIVARCSEHGVDAEGVVALESLAPAQNASGLLAAAAARLCAAHCGCTFDHERDGAVVGTMARIHGDLGDLVLHVRGASGEVAMPTLGPKQALSFVCTCVNDPATCGVHKGRKTAL